MSKNVVVIGAGLGGLSAAIYARLQGHDVLVVEQGRIGGKAAAIESGGYRFDPGPSIVILTEIYERLFRDAGRRPEDYLRFRRLDPISQVRFEGQQFALSSDPDECIRLANELGKGDGDNLRTLLQKLEAVAPRIERSIFSHPIEKPWQLAHPDFLSIGMKFDVRKTYRELVDDWFKSPLLRAFFYGFPSYSGQSYNSKAPGALLIPYYMLSGGVWYPEGGVAAIPAALERLARELGVEFRNARVTGVQKRGKDLSAVQTESGEAILADAVISNLDRNIFGDWLGRKTDVPPSYSYFTVQWGLKRRPEGLDHHSLVVPKDFGAGFDRLYRDRRFPEPPIVYLNEVAGTDPATAPPGGGNLFAVITCPAEEPGIRWSEEQSGFRESVLRELEAAGLDVPAHGIEVERVQTPTYFRETHGNYRGSLYGVDEAHRPFAGMLPPTNRDPEFRNLFYCGGSVQPGAGMPMVVLSGRFAAQALGK